MSNSICEECGLPFVICHAKGTVEWALKYRDKAEVAAHILPLLAGPVPDLVAQADDLLPDLQRAADDGDIDCKEAVRLIRALIALCQAQAAQIAGMREDITHWRGAADGHFNQAMKNGSAAVQERTRAEAAEAKLAEAEESNAALADKLTKAWAARDAAEATVASLKEQVEAMREELELHQRKDAIRDDEMALKDDLIRELEQELIRARAALRAMQAERDLARAELALADAGMTTRAETAEAKLAELERERDEWRRQAMWHNREHGQRVTELRAAEATVASLKEQVEAMRGALQAAQVIAKHGSEGTATAMIMHIAETLRAHGKAQMSKDDFGAQVLQFADAIAALEGKA